MNHEKTTSVARAASIISLGNVSSRILGLGREMVIAHFFGATGYVSAFRIAAKVPTMLYDLLVGGMVSSALVPVFSRYAAPERRAELWRLASLIISVAVIFLSILVLFLELFAPTVAWALGGGLDAELRAVATQLIRFTIPAIIFLGLSGILTGLLYALQRFVFPAFTVAAFNATIIVVTLFLARRIGIRSLALGLLLGAILQVALQLPGLRDMLVALSEIGFLRKNPISSLELTALRHILALYLPVILGLVINQIGVALDSNLASRTGESSIAYMQNATTLRQFPLGLVSEAVALAILPTLSRQAEDNAAFMATLTRGLRLVLMLIVPAAVGLFITATPIVQLIFEHGEFTPIDTAQTALALQYYMLGVIFAAIDQPLIFAFYARHDTLTPALVGVGGVIVYFIVAVLLLNPLGMIGLIIANSVQLTFHALVMLILLIRRVGSLRGHLLRSTIIKVGAATAVMALCTWGALFIIGRYPYNAVSAAYKLVRVAVAGGVGVASYGIMVYLLRVPEVTLLRDVARRKLRRGQ